MGEQDGGDLTARMRMLVADMQAQWEELDAPFQAFGPLARGRRSGARWSRKLLLCADLHAPGLSSRRHK